MSGQPGAAKVCFICGQEPDGTREVDGETVCADARSCVKRFEENLEAALNAIQPQEET